MIWFFLIVLVLIVVVALLGLSTTFLPSAMAGKLEQRLLGAFQSRPAKQPAEDEKHDDDLPR